MNTYKGDFDSTKRTRNGATTNKTKKKNQIKKENYNNLQNIVVL
jgi:hypothetical protein